MPKPTMSSRRCARGKGPGLDRAEVATLIFSWVGGEDQQRPGGLAAERLVEVGDGAVEARVVAGAELDRRVRRPHARAAAVQVQVLDDAERVRLRAPDGAGREADRVELAGHAGALEALEQLGAERGAVHRRALAGAHDPHLGRGRLRGQQVGERDAERVGQRVERLDRRVAGAGLELGERAAGHARAARELERGEARADAQVPHRGAGELGRTGHRLRIIMISR